MWFDKAAYKHPIETLQVWVVGHMGPGVARCGRVGPGGVGWGRVDLGGGGVGPSGGVPVLCSE